MESDNSSDEANNNKIVVNSVLCYVSNKRKNLNPEKLKNLVQRHFTSAEIHRAFRLLKRLTACTRPLDAKKGSSNGAPSTDNGAPPGVGSILKIFDAAKQGGWPLPEFAAVDISHFPDYGNHPLPCPATFDQSPTHFDRRYKTAADCKKTTDSNILMCILKEIGAVKRMVQNVALTSASLNGRPPTPPARLGDGATSTASDSNSVPPASLGSLLDGAPVDESSDEALYDEEEGGAAVESPDVLAAEFEDPSTDCGTTQANMKKQATGGRSIENAVAKLKAIRATTPESSKVKEEELSDGQRSEGSTRAHATPTVDRLNRRNGTLSPYSSHHIQLAATISSLAQQQQQRCAIFGPQAPNPSAFHQLLPAPYSELMNAVLYPQSKLQQPPFSFNSFPSDESKNRPANAHVATPPQSSLVPAGRCVDNLEEHWNSKGQMTAEQKLKLCSSSFANETEGMDKQLLYKRPMIKCQLDIESDGKPYICQQDNCNKRFANKFLLKKHEFIHTGERPHQCNYCSKRFNRKDNLLRHKKTHQASPDSFNLPSDSGVNRSRHSLLVRKRKHRPVCSNFHKFSMLTSPPIRAETGDKLSALLSMKSDCKTGKNNDCSTADQVAQVNDEEEDFPQDLRVQQSC